MDAIEARSAAKLTPSAPRPRLTSLTTVPTVWTKKTREAAFPGLPNSHHHRTASC